MGHAPPPSSDAVRRSMLGNRRRDTGPELRLRRELFARGLRYRVDHPVRPGSGRPIRVDIAFTRSRVAVFVDGCFWHLCPEHSHLPMANRSYWAAKLTRNAERDREAVARLTAAGWRVVRVWEHEEAVVAADRVAFELASCAPSNLLTPRRDKSAGAG